MAPVDSVRAFIGWSWSAAVLPNIELRKAALISRMDETDRRYLYALQTRLMFEINLSRKAPGDELHSELIDYIKLGDDLERISDKIEVTIAGSEELQAVKARVEAMLA